MDIALIVSDTGSLSGGDIAVRDRLQTTLGHTVTLHNDNDPAPSLTGIDLVVISPSCNNNAISNKYDDATCGVIGIGIEPHSAMSAGTFAGGGNTNPTFYVNQPGDPLVGVLTDDITMLTGAPSNNYQYYETTDVASGVIAVMTAGSGGGNRIVLARIPQGATLEGGVIAPTRRVFLGVGDSWPALFSTDGWAIFDNSVTYASEPPGQFPTADAGPDQEVTTNELVQLDGSGSSDTDGTITSYHWRLVSTTGPTITLSDPDIVNPTFTAPNVACTLILGLTVTDNNGLQSSESTMQITVVSRLTTRMAISGSWTEKPHFIAKGGVWY